MADNPRTFVLVRSVDVTGASGTGIVADGVLWPDRTVTVRWKGPRASTVCWATLDDAIAVHGHGGATRVVWNNDQLRATADARDEAARLRAELEDMRSELTRVATERDLLSVRLNEAGLNGDTDHGA